MYYKKLGFLLSLVLFFFLCLPEVSANPAFDSHKEITSSFQVPFLKEYTFNIDGKEVKTFLFINESKTQYDISRRIKPCFLMFC